MENQPPYFNFYLRLIRTLLERGVIQREMTVLVVAGGATDREIFRELGFTKVTITNLDTGAGPADAAPFQWLALDAENLACAENSYDVVMICAGLHHCHSPHRALLECYRVARRCAVVLEARDGFLSRIAVRLGVADEYEVSAVVGNQLKSGGVGNTALPNYIYRWTEREVEKTIASFAPHVAPNVVFLHEFAPPLVNLKARKSIRGLVLLLVAWPILWLITRVFTSQCNLIGFAVLKQNEPSGFFPWIHLEKGRPMINPQWAKQNFHAPPGEA